MKAGLGAGAVTDGAGKRQIRKPRIGLLFLLLAGCTANRTAAPVASPQPELRVTPPFVPKGIVESKATIECFVEVSGQTDHCRIVSFEGSPQFAQSALEYATHARYVPRTHNGVPVAATHRWNFQFHYR